MAGSLGRRFLRRKRDLLVACAGLLALAMAPAASGDVMARIGFLKVVPEDAPLPLSRLDLPVEDDGVAGARLGIDDNATTGRFLGQSYEMTEVVTRPEEALSALGALREEGIALFVVQADAETLLALTDAASPALVFNAQAPDDPLRLTECRANLFHIASSRAMRADGLAQYLVWKRWDEWLLIHGSHPADVAMGEAYARAAEKFGARVVETRVYEDTGGARRSDSGHVLVQRQMPVFTQDARRHDVVIAADETEVFGAYLPFRTWDPRPVAGDAGLEVVEWHPAHEGWGATQIQRRFEREANRRMRGDDFLGWLAVRVIGEAVTRTGSADPATLRGYLRSDDFEIAGFKGKALTFRTWNQQLRQPIMLANDALIVSVSPQEGFLHQRTLLDTLGFDEPETECSLDD